MARLIPLGNGIFAKVSNKDYLEVSKYRWYLLPKRPKKGGPYAHRNKPNHLYLHQFILSARGVDHKNGDGLDCRRSNLRLASQSQNNANQGIRKNNSSGAKGVYWDKENGKWMAQIRRQYKRHTIGRFDSVEDAAKAYNKKARELFGEFAWA